MGDRRLPNRRAGVRGGATGAAAADRRRPRHWPVEWECRWLGDGRVCFLERLIDDRWSVILERSTVAVVATKADALRVVDDLYTETGGAHASPRP